MGTSSQKPTTIPGNRTTDENIGGRISRLRKARGITQAKLAETIYCDKSVVSLWEQGKRLPDVDMVIKMAELFHVPVNYLLMGGDIVTDQCEQCCYQKAYLEIVEIISKYKLNKC